MDLYFSAVDGRDAGEAFCTLPVTGNALPVTTQTSDTCFVAETIDV